jgi:hypothetical protein
MEIAVFVLIMAVVGFVAYYAWQQKQKRREELFLFANQNHFQYSRSDPFGLVRSYGFRLFGMGDGRGCENVLTGEWQGIPVKEADYWYYTKSTDSNGNTTKHYNYFSVVVADLALAVPYVSVRKESLFSRLADHVGLRDVDFESEQFNREFNVKGPDTEFVFKLIDARMMQWLMSTGGEFGFEIEGSNLLTFCKRRKPSGLIPLLGATKFFNDHIPRLVWNEYGNGAGAKPEETERSTP